MGATPGLRPNVGGHQSHVIAAIEDFAQRAIGADVNFRYLLKSASKRRQLAALDDDDIIQESFFTVLNAAGHYDADRHHNHAEGYLVRSIQNCALALHVRERRHWSNRQQDEAEREGDTEELLANIPDKDGLDPEEVTRRLETIRLMRTAVDALTPVLRNIYELLYVKALTQRAAALKLGLTQARIAQLHRQLLTKAEEQLALIASRPGHA